MRSPGPRAQSRSTRARDEVAAFEHPGEGFAHVVVAWSDRAELARFEHDDAAWGRAVMARYVEHGSERTAHVYRDASGARRLRGHAYIGGCERTHIDVRVRELPDALEHWTMHTGEREHVDALLGAIPPSAIAIDDGWRDRYAGDPSTGAIDP